MCWGKRLRQRGSLEGVGDQEAGELGTDGARVWRRPWLFADQFCNMKKERVSVQKKLGIGFCTFRVGAWGPFDSRFVFVNNDHSVAMTLSVLQSHFSHDSWAPFEV